MTRETKRPYEIEIDEDSLASVGSQIKRIVQATGEKRIALKLLPEAKIVEELLDKGWREKDVIHYVVLSAINDWDLRWLRNGAEALWREMLNALENRPYSRTISYKSILGEVAKNLRKKGLRGHRAHQIRELGVILDQSESNKKLHELIDELSSSQEIGLSDIAGKLEELNQNLRNHGLRIPVDKVSNLIARTLYLMLGKKIRDKGTILYDLHVAKTSLRLGVTRVTPKNTELVAISIYDDKLKKKTVEAWGRISSDTNIPAWVIDSILWDVGKNYCILDDQEGRIDWSGPSCPQKRLAKRIRCPLTGACKASRQNLNILILGKYIAGTPIVLAYKK